MPAPTLVSIATDSGTSPTDFITRNTSLSFAGTADALSFVEVFVNGVSVAFGSANNNGDWSIDLTTQYGNFAEGVYSIQILSTFGNTSTFSSSQTLTIDLTPPAAPTISSISDDTGASATDGITTDNTLTLTGTAEANATVKIYDFGTEIATVQADSSGAWTYNTGNLGGDQGFSFSAAQTDLAGNAGPRSAEVPIFIDDTVAAPVITGIADDTGASGSDRIISDNTVTITGTAEAGATVVITDGSVIIGNVQADGSGNWTFTTDELADGTYSFDARQTDVAGNISAFCSAVSVTVDTAAPVQPTIDSAIATDTGANGADRITSDNTVTITGDAEAESIVTVRDGATVFGTAQADSSGEWTFTTGALADGGHNLTATATDRAGNGSAASGTLSVTIDATAPGAPVIAGISSDRGAFPNDGITNDNSLTINGTAEAGTLVTLTASILGTIGTATADQNGNWNVSYTFAEGGHSLTATATDTAGNVSVASSPYVVVVDTTAPSAPTIDDFTGNTGAVLDNITKNTVITLTGTTETTGVQVKVYDSNGFLGTASVDGLGQWSFTTGTLAEGTHEFSATATDIAGNESVESTEFSVVIDTTAPTAAVTSINRPGLGSFDTGASFSDEVTRDRTLILTGTTSEPMSSVTIYRDGNLIGTATSDSSGEWSYDYTGTVLTDGTYNFTAQATDIAGNTGAVSVALPVVIDNVAPAAALVTGIATDTGVSATDHITSDTNVVINGTAEANAVVEVYVDNVSLGFATANGSGVWSFDATATTLLDGQHSVTARVTDVAGNSQILATPFTFTVDTTPPAAPVIASIANDTGRLSTDQITNDATLTVSGTAEADASVTIIDTSNGNAIVGTVLADGSGNWSAAISALTEGTHNLRATATDAAGNSSVQTADFPVVVDTTLPTAPTITSFQSDTGISSTDGVTNDDFGYTVSGTADPGSIVRVYLDGGLSGSPSWTALADSNGNWSWDYNGGIGPSVQTFVATATDVAGNTSGFGPGYVVTFDYTAPVAAVITGISDDTGAEIPDGVTKDTTLTLNGTSEANAVIEVFEGSTSLGTTQANASGLWSFDLGTVTEGSHTYTADITDLAGNPGPLSSAFEVTVDTTPPATPAITSFSEDTAYIVPSGFPELGTSFSDGVTKDNTITLNGTGDLGATITILDGATVLGTAAVDSNGNWTYTTAALPDGNHSFTATATDLAGNASTASAATEVLIDTVNPLKPVLTGVTNDTGASSTDAVTSDNTFSIQGTGEPGTAIWLTSFNVPVGYDIIGGGLGRALVDVNGNWSIDLSSLRVFNPNYNGSNPVYVDYTFNDGSYTFFAESLDDAGNGSSFGSSFTVTIDMTAPAAPVITSFADDGGVGGDGLTNDNTVTLNGTAEAGSTVTVREGATTLGTAVADGSGNWTYTTAALSDAAHSFTATATDLAGNTGMASSALDVTIDTTPPSPPTIDATISDDTGVSGSDRLTNDNEIVLTGMAEPNSTVTIFDGVTSLGTAQADGAGVWSFTTPVLAEGSHSITATTTDAAGNVSSASVATDVIVDTVKPVLPVITGITTDTGVSSTDGITGDTTFIVRGTGEPGTTIFLGSDDVPPGYLVAGGAVGTTIVDSNGDWSIDLSSLEVVIQDPPGYAPFTFTDGNYTFFAGSVDDAGNASVVSSEYAVTIDTMAPATPSIVSALDDTGSSSTDGITKDDTITLSGTAEAGAVITVTDGATDIGTATADGSGNWSFTTGDLVDGDHSLSATATDAAGNESASSGTIAVTIDTAAPLAPTIDATVATDTGSSGTDRITSDTEVVLTGTAEANSTVTVFDGMTSLGTAQTNGAGIWSFTTPVLTGGSHAFTATATDTAGNIGTASGALSVTIDVTPPAAPVVASVTTDAGFNTTDGITNDNQILINGTAEAFASVSVFQGATQIGTATANANGQWSFDYTATTLADGPYVFTATATDAAGNTSVASAPLAVTVDTGAPTTPADANAAANTIAESVVNGATVGVTASSTDAGGVIYSLSDNAGGRFAIDSTAGVVTVADASLISFEAATSHNITVQATDLAGNATTQTFAIAVTNVAPTAPADNNAGANRVADNAANGALVGITALSGDIHGGTVTYSLTDNANGRFAIDTSTGVVTVADASLLDRTVNPSHSITVQASDGNLVSTSSFTIAVVNSGVVIDGTAGNDKVDASVSVAGQPLPTTLDDIINGLGGNDRLSGLAGDDVIDGGLGQDKMDGGAGNDIFIVDNKGDSVIEAVGGGIDLVLSSVSYELAKNVENLTLTGASNIAATGNASANILVGNAGNNMLKGGSGDDRLIGGGGNDILTGGNDHDTFVFSGAFGNDIIKDFRGNGAAIGDTIEIDSSIFANFAELQAAITDTGKNLVITHANGTITLEKVADISLLHASDFTFV